MAGVIAKCRRCLVPGKLLKRPPYTANRALVRVTADAPYTRVCDHYLYFRCPVCKANFAGALRAEVERKEPAHDAHCR